MRSLPTYHSWKVYSFVVTEIRVLSMLDDSTTYFSPIITKRISCYQSILYILFLIVEFLHEGCLLSVVQDEAVLVEGVTVHDNGCVITPILACIPTSIVLDGYSAPNGKVYQISSVFIKGNKSRRDSKCI